MVATNLWPLCSLVSTHFLLSVSFDGVCCVSLLPQKLSGTQEWLRVLELPPLQKVRRELLYLFCLESTESPHLPPSHSHSLTTILHHWFTLIGRSRCDCTHLANVGYITVSEVGRMATGSANSDWPLFVTQATSGAKSAICSFSFSRAFFETNIGK